MNRYLRLICRRLLSIRAFLNRDGRPFFKRIPSIEPYSRPLPALDEDELSQLLSELQRNEDRKQAIVFRRLDQLEKHARGIRIHSIHGSFEENSAPASNILNTWMRMQARDIPAATHTPPKRWGIFRWVSAFMRLYKRPSTLLREEMSSEHVARKQTRTLNPPPR